MAQAGDDPCVDDFFLAFAAAFAAFCARRCSNNGVVFGLLACSVASV